MSFEAGLAPAAASPRPVVIGPDSPFDVRYSSGTTGTPKGIVQSHRMRWRHLQRIDYGDDAVTLISTPLYSNTALVSMIPARARGGTVVLLEKFDVERYLELAERHRAAPTVRVPVPYRRLLARPAFEDCELPSLRMKYATSAPFPAALEADVFRRWPGGPTEFHGRTEGGGVRVLSVHEHPGQLRAAGCPPRQRVSRDRRGRPPPRGRRDRRGRRPLRRDDARRSPATAEAGWRDAGGTCFIRAGDVGRIDPDGFLTLRDRRTDMGISGGFNVYPSDLDAVPGAHAAVVEAAVIGVPSERWGETPVAVVVLRPDAHVDAQELRARANGRRGATQGLAALTVVPELPRSAIGRILERKLRARVASAPRPGR